MWLDIGELVWNYFLSSWSCLFKPIQVEPSLDSSNHPLILPKREQKSLVWWGLKRNNSSSSKISCFHNTKCLTSSRLVSVYYMTYSSILALYRFDIGERLITGLIHVGRVSAKPQVLKPFLEWNCLWKPWTVMCGKDDVQASTQESQGSLHIQERS